MPNPKQRERVATLRKEVDRELEEEMRMLKTLQKQEKDRLKEAHQSQQAALVLQKRKKFLDVKEAMIKEATNRGNN